MGSRLRIAHLTTVDMSLALLLATELRADAERGHDVIGISASGRYVPDVEALGVRHHPVRSLSRSWNVRADLRAAVELWRVLRNDQLDVLHTHNPKTGVLGRVIGRLAGVPVVVNTCHGLWVRPEDGPLKKTLVYGIEGFAALFSDAELYQNDADRLALSWAVQRRKARTVGNGVDLDLFRHSEDGRRRVRGELGLSDGDVLVGGVGRLVAEKGIQEFATAGTNLEGKAAFVWIGPDDDVKSDRLVARPSGVRFLGERRDMTDVYSALDVFVLPSHREGFSRSAMEAAACGCAMVLSDIRGCREIGVDGEHLLLVPPGDPEALTSAIERLIGDRGLRTQLAVNAEARARVEFDQRRVAAISLATYDRVLARRSGGLAYAVAKRAIDLAVAALALVALAPVLALVAAIVRVTMGSPVLFRQQRPGRDDEPFTIYKFRTMSCGDCDASPATDTLRLTRTGRLLRALSLDELPELWNVVRGDMSLVGPRPLLMQYLDRYTPDQARRHEVRPGMTGLAQVRGRNALSWEDRLAMDVWYVDNRSLALDLRILALTFASVVRRRGITEDGGVTMSEFMGVQK